jgi:hypothetical protein
MMGYDYCPSPVDKAYSQIGLKAKSMNIQFNYLYRDAGNHKVFGSEVFSNSVVLTVEEIELKIRANLIDGEFFDPKKWGLPRLGFSDWDDEIDHTWNEFESVEATEEEVTIGEIGVSLKTIVTLRD